MTTGRMVTGLLRYGTDAVLPCNQNKRTQA